MIELTDENFKKEVLETADYVLVDFYMSGCFPCKMIAPIINKLAEEYKDKMAFKKAELKNVWTYCEKYRINSAPTIILFKNGDPISGFVGYREENEIREWINENLKHN